MRKCVLALLSLLALTGLGAKAEEIDVFSYSERKGGSSLNLLNAMEVMTMETVCSFDDMAHAYGFRPAFYQRELFFDLEGDTVEEELDGSLSILYRNGHRAKAETRWPKNTELAASLPEPDEDYAVVAYSVYDDETLQIEFSVLDVSYASEYREKLREFYPNPLVDSEDLYVALSDTGRRVSFSLERKVLLLELL